MNDPLSSRLHRLRYSRRGFLATTAASAGAAVVGLNAVGSASSPAAAHAALGPSPASATVAATGSALDRLPFSWNSVPVAADVGDGLRPFSAEEVSFLSSHFSMVSIEKSMGGYPYTEQGFHEAAQALKAEATPPAVLFYWNANRAYPDIYESMALPAFMPEWVNSQLQFAIENPDFRTWWVDQAVAMASETYCDGIFMDAFGSAYLRNRNASMALISQLRNALDALPGTPRLIYYNGGDTKLRANGLLHEILDYADGVYIEHFYRTSLGRGMTRDYMQMVMNGMRQASTEGKSVFLHGWPTFDYSGTWDDTATYEQEVARARADIQFPLACFLAAAGEKHYFQYAWGWNRFADRDHGVWIRTSEGASTVDPTWYPELLQGLGAPSGPALVDGAHWIRTFAHATVEVDLDAKTSSITWT